MATKTAILRSIRGGRSHADHVLERRGRALKRRQKALRTAGVRVPRMILTAGATFGAPTSAGILLAEGDSWFDYPFHDVLKELEDGYAYDVECLAHKGDPIEEMAYGGGQLEEVTRRLEKLIRDNKVPKAILLSGGGNDVAGDAFEMLLNHKDSAIAGLNEQVVEGVIGERVHVAYAYILGAVTRVSEQMLNRRLPILVHGYDHPVPDGRGFWGGWGPLPGPWLEPGFRQKGFDDLQRRIDIARDLIDRLNAMLRSLCAMPQFSHVHHVDLRETLSVGSDYKRWWDNELHPTEKGFKAVAEKFQAVLAALP